MKCLSLLALCLAAASCNSTGSVEWVDYGGDPMQNPQYMTDMMAAGTPGAEHAALASLVGSWKVEGMTWEPGMEPTPMVATAETKALLDGRYIVEDFTSDFMGMPFQGRLTQGYNNVTGQYWSVWFDSMSTGCWVSYGTETSPGVIELHGTANDILTPGGRPMRMTVTVDSADSYTMRMYDTRQGAGEFKSMELHYKRQ